MNNLYDSLSELLFQAGDDSSQSLLPRLQSQFGDSRKRSGTIFPDPHETFKDEDDQTNTLQSILSYGDDDSVEEEILRPNLQNSTGTLRSETFVSLFENLLQSETRRSPKRRPQFPGVSERTTTTNAGSRFSELKAVLEVFNNALSGDVDLDDLLESSKRDEKSKRSPASWAPLHFAAQRGSVSLCQAILEKGAPVDPRESGDRTPLSYASQQGHIDVCKLLLDSGANSNAAGKKGITPLISAGLNGHLDVIELLISKGANIEARAIDESTLLHLAVYQGARKENESSYDVAKLLLEKGSDPNAADENGHTPLLTAAMWSGLPFAELLLAHGANPNISHNRGKTPLACAAAENDPAMVRLLLLHGADPTAQDHRLWTPLHLSAQHDHEHTLDVVKILLDAKDIDVNSEEERGVTALYLAAQADRVDVAEALLTAGADPDVVTKGDIRALEKAVVASNLKMVDLLLHHGASTARVDQKGYSILHAAASQKDPAVLRRILAAGVDLELTTTDEVKVRSLHLAVQNENEEIAMILLEHGAQP